MAPAIGESANKFAEGERVLCFHGPLIYEAKCLKYRTNPKESFNEYWVHYAGWNKNWDEWVPETRILKYNDGNVARQKDLQRAHKGIGQKKSKNVKLGVRISGVKDSKPSDARSEGGSVNDPDSRSSTPILDPRSRLKNERKGGSPTSSQESCSDVPKLNKRSKQDSFVETEQQYLNKVEVRIKLPDELKPWLVDDKIMVIDQKKSVILPAKFTVETILDMYIQSKRGRTNDNVSRMCHEVVLGIKDYFNGTLQSKLLYKVERPAVQEILEKNPNLTPSQIAGAVHLLRLFVCLGSMLAYTNINEKSMQYLKTALHDVLKYLATNVGVFFNLNNYI